MKADLENAERFFMKMTSEAEWSIGSVRDVLPPPERPLKTVVAEDPFLTTWYPRDPTFRLTVDENVQASTDGS